MDDLTKPVNDPAGAESELNGGLCVSDRRDRLEIITDLVTARKSIFDLQKALKLAIRQNECDMLLTGDELRECRKALSPNVN